MLLLHGCILCGEKHPLKIHAYVTRKVRSRAEENIEIIIIVIYCENAKKHGKQYTKRLLPHFVIPECNIDLENVLQYIVLHPDGSVDFDDASQMLGTQDIRTIDKHIARAMEIIKKTNLTASELLSRLPGFATLPAPEGKLPIEYLEDQADELFDAAERMIGGRSDFIMPIQYVHIVYTFEKARNPLLVPSNRVFHALLFNDTS
ncbi:MAG: hypothetical protein IMF11_14015 [Proteobacteria bacterium]|nr:hypothetical protein [Pseudomonadota bacterium]